MWGGGVSDMGKIEGDCQGEKKGRKGLPSLYINCSICSLVLSANLFMLHSLAEIRLETHSHLATQSPQTYTYEFLFQSLNLYVHSYKCAAQLSGFFLEKSYARHSANRRLGILHFVTLSPTVHIVFPIYIYISTTHFSVFFSFTCRSPFDPV